LSPISLCRQLHALPTLLLWRAVKVKWNYIQLFCPWVTKSAFQKMSSFQNSKEDFRTSSRISPLKLTTNSPIEGEEENYIQLRTEDESPLFMRRGRLFEPRYFHNFDVGKLCTKPLQILTSYSDQRMSNQFPKNQKDLRKAVLHSINRRSICTSKVKSD
jgi:hypothetical protein